MRSIALTLPAPVCTVRSSLNDTALALCLESYSQDVIGESASAHVQDTYRNGNWLPPITCIMQSVVLPALEVAGLPYGCW